MPLPASVRRAAGASRLTLLSANGGGQRGLTTTSSASSRSSALAGVSTVVTRSPLSWSFSSHPNSALTTPHKIAQSFRRESGAFASLSTTNSSGEQEKKSEESEKKPEDQEKQSPEPSPEEKKPDATHAASSEAPPPPPPPRKDEKSPPKVTLRRIFGQSELPGGARAANKANASSGEAGDKKSSEKSESKKESESSGGGSKKDQEEQQSAFAQAAQWFLGFLILSWLGVAAQGGNGSGGWGQRVKEIDWQTLKYQLLATGEIERIVIVNKSVARIYTKTLPPSDNPSEMRRHGSSSGTRQQPLPQEPSPFADDPATSAFEVGAPVPVGGAKRPTTHNQPSYYMPIGTLESFERRLDEAQKELNIQPDRFLPVQYVTEEPMITADGLGLTLSVVMIVATVMMLSRLRGSLGAGMPGPGGGGGGGPLGMFGVGKSKAKKYGGIDGEKVTVRFGDVAGCDESKTEISEFVDFLKDPARYHKLGAKIPRGALLYGPPGTGKTLLAKAVAGEAGVPFFSTSGAEFSEMFVGVGSSRVRDLFAEARKAAPCIIFIDEIDSLARKRRSSPSGSGDESNNTLNQLLVEMDGFGTKDGVVVIGATNRLDILDDAILRPGRFDRQIKVEVPDIRGRRDVFLVHMKKLTFDPAFDVEAMAQRLAALTPGFSGAEIANVCNESAIMAARDRAEHVTDTHMDRAVDRIIGGIERTSSLLSPAERNTVAVHECGHAIAGWFLEHADPLLKVTIVPRISGALGYAQYLPKEVSLYSKRQFEDRICMALGGRAAEELAFGTVTNGAQDDLKKVTELAYQMVTGYGMSSKVGQVSQMRERNYSDKTTQIIDEEVREIIDASYQRVLNLLREKKDIMDALTARLLEKETISQHDIEEIAGKRQWANPVTYAEFVRAGAEAYKKKAAEAAGSTPTTEVPPVPAAAAMTLDSQRWGRSF